MPIAAQCRSCAARYKVVDSAAGRRVKCRRCGKSITVPGGEAPAEPSLDLRAVLELERKGQVLATTPEAEYQQYQSAVATLTKADEKVAAKKDYRSIHDLATPQAKAKFAAGAAGARPAEPASKMLPLLMLGVMALAAGAAFLPQMALVNALIAWALLATGNIWGLVVAFMEDTVSGLLYLFLPFYNIYFWLKHGYESRYPVRLVVSGVMLNVLTLIATRVAASMHGG